MLFKLILRRLEVVFSYVWSENAALFERLMEIHSNPNTMALNTCIIKNLCENMQI